MLLAPVAGHPFLAGRGSPPEAAHPQVVIAFVVIGPVGHRSGGHCLSGFSGGRASSRGLGGSLVSWLGRHRVAGQGGEGFVDRARAPALPHPGEPAEVLPGGGPWLPVRVNPLTQHQQAKLRIPMPDPTLEGPCQHAYGLH